MPRHEFIVPFMLVDAASNRGAMEQTVIVDGYDDTLTGDDVYVEGDLVEVDSGTVKRSHRETAANVPPLFLAGANHTQTFGLTRGSTKTRTLRDVPLNDIPPDNIFVMTYQDDAADDADHEFVAADLQAVQARERREIAWNDEEKCYTVRDGTTNPAVTLLGVFKGEVGDDNVRVLVRLDPNGAS